MPNQFQIHLYDKITWLQIGLLETTRDLSITEQLNGEHQLRFTLPATDPAWTTLSFRQIVRLVDTRADSPSTAITGNPSATEITVQSAEGFANGDYILIAVTQGSGDTQAYRTFVAKITSIGGVTFTLSRKDFTPNTEGYDFIRKVNFTTWRVAPETWKRDRGQAVDEVVCEHLGYLLNDRFYRVDGRTDAAYGLTGHVPLVGESIDPDTMLTTLLADEPSGWGGFIKGTVTGALTTDARAFAFSGRTRKRVGLVELCRTWTDDQYLVHFTVNEDMSVDLTRFEPGTGNDPTSGLTVDVQKNMNQISRQFNTDEFGNVCVAEGSRGDWINGTTGIYTLVQSDSANTKDSFHVANPEKFRHGDPVQVLYNPIDSTVTGGTANTLADSTQSLDLNEFEGGVIFIYDNTADGVTGVGQIRNIESNTTGGTFTVTREFDVTPTSDMEYFAARGVDTTFSICRGFSVKEGTATAATTSSITDTNLTLVANVYNGGIVNLLKGGVAAPQTKTLRSNTTGGVLNLTLGDSFDPTPAVGQKFEIIAPPIQIEQHGVLEGETLSSAASTVTVSPTPAWPTDLWAGATVRIVKGLGKGDSKTVASNTAATLTISGTWSSNPNSTSEILISQANDVELSVETLPKPPQANDVVILLGNRPNGSPLTVGEHFDYRDYVNFSEVDKLDVKNDVSKFAVNQTVFVGTKGYERIQGFILRGNQWDGVHRKVTAINGTVLTIDPELTTLPAEYDHIKILSLVDATSITAYQRREFEFVDGNQTNPLKLANDAQTEIDRRKNPVSTYRVDTTDLFRLDPVQWRFDQIQLGQTFRVIDSEFGIDSSSLVCIGKAFDPNDPMSLKLTIDNFSGLLEKRFEDEITDILRENAQIHALAEWSNYIADLPKCVHFDPVGRRCMKNTPPNTFCNGRSVNGKTTVAGIPLTRANCQSFDGNRQGTGDRSATAVFTATFNATNVTNDAFDNTNRVEVKTDFVILSGSAHVVEAKVNSSGSLVEASDAAVEIQTDSDGTFTASDTETGHGGFIRYRRTVATNALDITVMYILTGLRT